MCGIYPKPIGRNITVYNRFERYRCDTNPFLTVLKGGGAYHHIDLYYLRSSHYLIILLQD